jgi:hypothetical protein
MKRKKMRLNPFRKEKCDKIKEMLSSYIDKHLSPQDEEEVRTHLAQCKGCRREFESLTSTVELLHRTPTITPHPLTMALPSKFVDLLAHRKASSRPSYALPATILAVLLSVGALLFYLNPGGFITKPTGEEAVEAIIHSPVEVGLAKSPSSLFRVASPQEGENLVQNSSFEEGELNFPYYWQRAAIYTPGLELSWDRGVSHSGSASISIRNGDTFNLYPNNWRQVIRDIPINKHLVVSGYIKTEDLSRNGVVAVLLRCLNSEGKLVEFATTQAGWGEFSGTRDWTKVGADIVSPDGTVEIQVVALLCGTGQVWFDDIELIAK